MAPPKRLELSDYGLTIRHRYPLASAALVDVSGLEPLTSRLSDGGTKPTVLHIVGVSGQTRTDGLSLRRAAHYPLCYRDIGTATGVRTPDLLLGKQAHWPTVLLRYGRSSETRTRTGRGLNAFPLPDWGTDRCRLRRRVTGLRIPAKLDSNQPPNVVVPAPGLEPGLTRLST